MSCNDLSPAYNLGSSIYKEQKMKQHIPYVNMTKIFNNQFPKFIEQRYITLLFAF